MLLFDLDGPHAAAWGMWSCAGQHQVQGGGGEVSEDKAPPGC